MTSRNNLYQNIFATMLAVAWLGCDSGDSSMAIDIQLVVDPNQNTEQQVLATLDYIQTTLDSEEGLYPEDFESPSQDLRIANVDQDSALELQMDVPIPPQTQKLPTIRIAQGRLPVDVLLNAIFVGKKGGKVFAQGNATDLSFVSDAKRSVSFNIHPQRLPPKVTHVIPTHTDALQHCYLTSILVMFSKPVQIQDPEAIRFKPMKKDTRFVLDPDGRYVRIENPGFVEIANDDQNSDEFPHRILYEFSIDQDAISDGSQPLDQLSAIEGNQPFFAKFSIPCRLKSVLKTILCATPPRLLRDENQQCVPGSCNGTVCPDGFFCNPNQFVCDVDCRNYLPENGCIKGICNVDTGVCELP